MKIAHYRIAVTAMTVALALGGCGGQPKQASHSESESSGGSVASQDAAPPLPKEVKLDPECDQALAKTTVIQCEVCHSLQKGQPNMTGPDLWDVVGRKAASMEGFAYSPALKAKGITWDEKTLDSFLANPQTFVSGTRMAFGGVKDAAARAAAICYLKALH